MTPSHHLTNTRFSNSNIIVLKTSEDDTLKTEIILNASKEKAWDVLTTFDQYEKWKSLIVSSKGETVVRKRLTNRMLINGKSSVPKII